ncbi:MAG: hypothetical protein ACKV2O_02955 [Acidimicrobiales bacterium]
MSLMPPTPQRPGVGRAGVARLALVPVLRLVLVATLSTLAVSTLASCRKDPAGPRSDADLVYAATIEALANEHRAAVPDVASTTQSDQGSVSSAGQGAANGSGASRPLLAVFVEPLGEGYVIDLATQARVVTALETVVQVRFIDHRAEAIDEDRPGKPVRDEGTLVAVGPIVSGGAAERTVQARRYLSTDRWVDTVAHVSGAGESLRVVLGPA